MMSEPLTVYRDTVDAETGAYRLRVERWPRETEIEDVLLAQEADWLHLRGDTVTIIVSNGQAVYHLGEGDPYRLARPAHLISARLTDV